ncbi:hypothetical protein [Devosia sp.]|uniref:hypothetical protein n=1 Tax=Devosia sp. TaxID=1871048 RepID=UPI002FCC4684
MRRISVAHAGSALHLSRGWLVLAAMLASWVFMAGLWTGGSQLFAFVATAI